MEEVNGEQLTVVSVRRGVFKRGVSPSQYNLPPSFAKEPVLSLPKERGSGGWILHRACLFSQQMWYHRVKYRL
jgi:hypothetical protein